MKQRRDLRLLIAAALLLVCAVFWILWSSRSVRERREATLAGVPAFPQPHQEPQRRPIKAAQPGLPAAPAPRPPPPVARGRQDNMLSFVHGSGGTVALIHVNALFNTPLFERLRQCMPKEFQDLETGMHGVDFTRDIDQVAMIPGGLAMTGFFDGKALAAQMLKSGAPSEEYRGATVVTGSSGQCTAQQGSMLLFSSSGDCKGMVDRALTPTTDAAQDEVYGDVYMRTDLAGMRTDSNASPALKPLVDALSGLTLRANVWDSMALSVEGNPISGQDASDLARMASGAVQVFKGQLDDDQVELRALAELAKVNTSGGKLNLEMALPVADLFEKLHIPCPGLEDAGVP
jgi:hypothetical protein